MKQERPLMCLLWSLNFFIKGMGKNSSEHKQNPLEFQNDVLTDLWFLRKIFESFAKIGGRTVYDLILQSETKEVENYCILVHKTPLAIGKTWAGSKTKLEWEEENGLTHLLG